MGDQVVRSLPLEPGYKPQPVPERARKATMFPHRAHRKVVDSSFLFLTIEQLVMVAPFIVVIYLVFPALQKFNCLSVGWMIGAFNPGEPFELMAQPFLGQEVYILGLRGTYPTPAVAYWTAVTALLLVILLPKIKPLPRAIGLWGAYAAGVMLVSATFFYLAPERFPYSVAAFSELYMKTEASMWMVMVLLLGLALMPIPAAMPVKMAVIGTLLVLDVLLSMARYAAFMFVVHEASLMYMALLYFVFGPLIDFFYVVVTYSYFMHRVSDRVNSKLGTWKWSF